MPLSKTHVPVSIVTIIIALVLVSIVWKWPFTSAVDVLVIIFLTVFYSTLPDIDSRMSSSRKWAFSLMFFLLLCSYAIYKYLIPNDYIFILFSAIGLLGLLANHSKHRGIFHTPLMGAFLSFPLFFLNPYYVGVSFLAFCSHLAADRLMKTNNNKPRKSSIKIAG